MHPRRLLGGRRLSAAGKTRRAARAFRVDLRHDAQALPRGLEARHAHGRHVLAPTNPAFEQGLCSQRPVGLLGPMVDPLGELLMKLLPEGLRALLAPAVALPALVLPPPAAPLMPVVVPLVVDPVAEAPPV